MAKLVTWSGVLPGREKAPPTDPVFCLEQGAPYRTFARKIDAKVNKVTGPLAALAKSTWGGGTLSAKEWNTCAAESCKRKMAEWGEIPQRAGRRDVFSHACGKLPQSWKSVKSERQVAWNQPPSPEDPFCELCRDIARCTAEKTPASLAMRPAGVFIRSLISYKERMWNEEREKVCQHTAFAVLGNDDGSCDRIRRSR